MEVELVPLDSLETDPKNARTHERGIPELAESLREFGQRKPLVVWHDTVMAGNGLLEAADSLGWTQIAITRVPDDWPYEKAQAYALADNRTAELSSWDVPVLHDLRRSLDAAGWSTEKFGFDALPKLVNFGDSDPDDVPDVPDAPRAAVGDVWVLGDHRLVCGDATDRSPVLKAMGGSGRSRVD